ncbi:MAG: hypothetical protein ABFS28_09310 [Bacteroidota bacterium]
MNTIQHLKALFLSFIFVILFSSCTYDNEEDYYSNNICDTTNVTFAETIYPILDANCISCHSGVSANAGIELGTYDAVKEVAESGLLIGVIKHLPGYVSMPPNLPMLDECSISKIETWIRNGSPID